MDIYYKLPASTVQELVALCEEGGRAAHMARNYAGGFANLNHPEVLTIDTVCGQIEGQLRAVMGHIKESKEIKQILTLVAKAATFMSKILKPDFTSNKSVPDESYAKIVELVAALLCCTQRMDLTLNEAIMRHSADLFEMAPMPVCAPQGEHTRNSIVQRHFEASAEDKGRVSAAVIRAGRTPEEQRHLGIELGAWCSNKAHLLQDACSGYLLNPAKKDAANRVINLAGATENEARVLITICQTHKNVPEAAFKGHLDNLCKHINTIRDEASQPAFALNQCQLLHSGLEDFNWLTESCRQCIAACA